MWLGRNALTKMKLDPVGSLLSRLFNCVFEGRNFANSNPESNKFQNHKFLQISQNFEMFCALSLRHYINPMIQHFPKDTKSSLPKGTKSNLPN